MNAISLTIKTGFILAGVKYFVGEAGFGVR